MGCECEDILSSAGCTAEKNTEATLEIQLRSEVDLCSFG
jgi:hypothetical protein